MIYPADFEEKIGFIPLRRLLAEKCVSPMGARRVTEMSFLTDYPTVRRLLSETDEMLRLIRAEADLPTDNLHDVTPYLNEIRAEGSFMSAERLYKLRMLLAALRNIRDFFSRTKDESDTPLYPALNGALGQIVLFPALISAIDKVINKFGEVRDDASAHLLDIRREMQSAQSRMSTIMRRVIDKAVAAGVVAKDTSPSIRDGRLVIPVQAGEKRGISGIVHDESATGKTVFIEPTEVVQAGNRLRELQLEEQRETIRILTETASLIRPEIDGILVSAATAGYFDFIRSKAIVASMTDAQMPTLAKNPEIEWYHAVHPTLKLTLEAQGRKVVPLDIRLSGEERFLIISGPNAGGKSVCLKTVGIVQYMTQCGMLPPLYSNSHVGVFDKIFIDIGDSQSIENDLSTYSSHLRNMKFFIRNADKRTLILADEMGSGTEPQIGGALAQAILEKLSSEKCFGVVTTHYQNLKTFADSEPGFVNGAMLYDRQHLQPTFQLAVGNPGSSFAIEIATKTGLPHDVIEKAKELVGSDYVNMDRYMLDIARDRRYWNNKRLSIKEKESKLDSLLEKYEAQAGDLRSQRAEIIRDARREAKEIMQTANARLEKAIREIRESVAEKERTKEIRAELEAYRRSLEEKEEPLEKSMPEALKVKFRKPAKPGHETAPKAKEKASLKEGDYVRMSDGGVVGKILSIDGRKAQVAFGALRMQVELDKLKSAAPPKPKASEQTFSVSAQTTDDSRRRQLDFNREIDVRGMRADEALQAVTYFLDDAVQFSADRVRILHGKGNGILRQLIRQYLNTNPAVASFADEDIRFGGAGITVVNLE